MRRGSGVGVVLYAAIAQAGLDALSASIMESAHLIGAAFMYT